MELGRIGVWTGALERLPTAVLREHVAELDELGYGALWTPDAFGRDPFVTATLVAGATERLIAASGIASIYGRDPVAMRAAWESVTEASGGRFLLGLGVSHAPMVESMRGHVYGPPLTAMRAYLDDLDGALYLGATGDAEPRRVLAALGPKMLALAAERASGAHTYFVPVEHTVMARETLGAGPLLAPEQAVVLETDPDEARRIAREHLAIYLGLPNYVRNLARFGLGGEDVADGGSDRLVDAIVAWGSDEAIAARVRAHLDAGADHVCVQVLTAPQFRDCMPEWRTLAPALLT